MKIDQNGLGRAGRIATVLLAGAAVTACASVQPKYAVRGPGAPAITPSSPGHKTYKTGEPYQVGGIWYVPHDQPRYNETGMASWYGDAFNMKATANGEIFDMNQFSAAHTTLPLPSMVEVTNLDNGRKLVVRVNDRGPFVDNRLIDLSRAAATELGYDRAGLAHVRVRYIGPAPLAGPDAGLRYATATPRLRPTTLAAAPIAMASAAAMPGSVTVSALPPPTPVAVAALPPLAATTLPVAAQVTASPTWVDAAPVFRIQAGAFSDEGNARRAADQLAVAGKAVVEPIHRDGLTLYRVVVAGPADEAEAFALRDRVAQIGFADARVIRPQNPTF